MVSFWSLHKIGRLSMLEQKERQWSRTSYPPRLLSNAGPPRLTFRFVGPPICRPSQLSVPRFPPPSIPLWPQGLNLFLEFCFFKFFCIAYIQCTAIEQYHSDPEYKDILYINILKKRPLHFGSKW